MSSQGDQLRQKADKKAASSSGFSFFSSSSSKFEEAYDLYTSAANQFKIENRHKDAGDCFCKAAEMALKNDEKDDAANSFWTASKSYKKSHPELAVAALQQSIALLMEKGRFRQAADRNKEIASILQQEGGDLAGALQAYEQAAQIYMNEDAQASANGCLKEAAELAAQIGDYQRAVQHFEQVASQSLASALTRYGVKEYYLKAGLCWLATADVVSTKRAIDSYCNADPSFATTRECKFLNAIADAFDGGDAEAFTAEVAEFDRLTRLDQLKTTLLLNIKRNIAEEPRYALSSRPSSAEQVELISLLPPAVLPRWSEASNAASRGSGSGRKKTKRNRVHSSCEACRIAKQRCSREVVCVNCKLRGKECVYINAEPLPSSYVPFLLHMLNASLMVRTRSSDDPSADEVALLNHQLHLAHLEIDRLRDEVAALQQRMYDPPAGMLASHLGRAQEEEAEEKSLPPTPTSPTFFPDPSVALPPPPPSYTFPFPPALHHAGSHDLPLPASPHPRPPPPPTSVDFLPLPFAPPPPPVLPSPTSRSYSLHQPLPHSLAAFPGPAPTPSVQVQVQVHRSASLPSPSFIGGGDEGDLVPFPLPCPSSSVPTQLGGGGVAHPFERAALEGGSGRGRGRPASHPGHSLFDSVDLSTSSTVPPLDSTAEQDWTTTLDPVPVSTPSTLSRFHEHFSSAEDLPDALSAAQGRRREVRRTKSAATGWSSSAASSGGATAAWQAHVSRAGGQRRRSASLDESGRATPSSSAYASFPDSPSSRPSKRTRSPSLPAELPARGAPSPVVSWRGRHESYTVGGEKPPKQSVRRAVSTLSLGAMELVRPRKREEERKKEEGDGLLSPPRETRGKKGSWEYQAVLPHSPPRRPLPKDFPNEPPLAAVKSSTRASIQYAAFPPSSPARGRRHSSFSSLRSLIALSPEVRATCVVDLTALSALGGGGGGGLRAVTEASKEASWADSGTVVIPFPPALPPSSQDSTTAFPPSPPVPLSSLPRPQRSFVGRLGDVSPGAWLFVGGFVCLPAWWVGAFWPAVEAGEGGGEGRKEGEKGIEGGKWGLKPPASSKYTALPSSSLPPRRSRTPSALTTLLGSSSTSLAFPSSAEARRRAEALVWRRRNRLMSLLSMLILAAVVGFAVWGSRRT
ncbi:hypothetical protein JCM8097_005580 [Rhodosporidiobolus ruineniae]